MVTEELRYECITSNFLIDECRITEFFSGYIINFVKHVSSTSSDMLLVDEELCAVKPQESLFNAVADEPKSSTRAVAHHASVSHQTFCKVLNENRLYLFHFASTSFESGRLSSTVSGWYSNVRCTWTS
ncbi:hypothetical protein TNCV_1474381 [Trichonephila clavipes]|nr:hypothetical protein TNCV_1474381 [Trichonephila clavipes]